MALLLDNTFLKKYLKDCISEDSSDTYAVQLKLVQKYNEGDDVAAAILSTVELLDDDLQIVKAQMQPRDPCLEMTMAPIHYSNSFMHTHNHYPWQPELKLIS